jgi:hypothetical protein
MRVVLIPITKNNEPFVAWLEENIAPQDSARQAYVRKYGSGWDLTTVRDMGDNPHNTIYWQVTIEDEHMALLFALRWS